MKGFLLVLLLIAIVSCVEVVNETEKDFDWKSILGFLLPLLKQYGVPFIVNWCNNFGLGDLCQTIIDALLKMLGA